MKKVFAEFRAFIMQGNVLDLAVAVIVGASFKTIVDSLVNDILLPIISAVVGKPDFSELTLTLGNSVVRYGSFLTQVINFLIIGASLFVIIKAFEKLQGRRRRGEIDEPPPRTDVELLTEIRDELRRDAVLQLLTDCTGMREHPSVPEPSPLHVVGLDHVVLNVADAERALAFYGGTLGLQPVRVDEWRRGDAPFPSMRIDERTIIDLVEAPRSGENVGHLCLVVEPVDFAELRERGRLDVVDGPGTRFGAQGDGTSVYVRDPDGNIVELKHYPGTEV